MKKNYYRLQLFGDAPQAAKAVVLKAAQCNAGVEIYDLQGLAAYGNGYNQKLAAGYEETQFEIIGENLLHIDCKLNGSYETVAIIEEIEIWEPVSEFMEMENEEPIL